MSNRLERANAVAAGIEEMSLDFIAYIPSNSIAPVINHCRELAERGPLECFPVAREEEAVGIIGAVSLAGKRGAIVMQDNGFGNALTALTTFAVAYHRPMLILANTRGGLGEYNSMIHTISQPVPEILRASDIPCFTLDRRNSVDDWRATVIEAENHSRMTHRPVVVLMDFWDASGEKGTA